MSQERETPRMPEEPIMPADGWPMNPHLREWQRYAFAIRAALRERLAKAREEAIEECAKVCDTLVFGTEISEWQRMTKKDVSRRACLESAAAIRALKQKGADHE